MLSSDSASFAIWLDLKKKKKKKEREKTSENAWLS
jgi:hypothetical protein